MTSTRCTHCDGFGGHNAYPSQPCPKCGLVATEDTSARAPELPVLECGHPDWDRDGECRECARVDRINAERAAADARSCAVGGCVANTEFGVIGLPQPYCARHWIQQRRDGDRWYRLSDPRRLFTYCAAQEMPGDLGATQQALQGAYDALHDVYAAFEFTEPFQSEHQAAVSAALDKAREVLDQGDLG